MIYKNQRIQMKTHKNLREEQVKDQEVQDLEVFLEMEINGR